MEKDNFNIEAPKKGLTEQQCLEKASEYIDKNGVCLFLMDVAGSRNFPDRKDMYERVISMVGELNELFEENLPESDIIAGSPEKGFIHILGDGIIGAIDDASVVPEVLSYTRENYPDLPLWYGVAEDGWDEQGIKVIK